MRPSLVVSQELLLVQSFAVKLKFTILFIIFLSEQPFYENDPALDSHARPTRQDGFPKSY